MKKRGLLMIGLDGYEQSLGNKMIEAGELPALASLREDSACWLLDHGSATRTGLAWEHFATGKTPQDARRYSPVHFNPENYKTWQQGTTLEPFIKGFAGNAVMFDTPYFDLQKTPGVCGITNWGAHDPGVATRSNPPELIDEIEQKFGPYPAKNSLYAIIWNSPEKTGAMAEALLAGIRKRAAVSRWLLEEKIRDWDLAIVTVSEFHSSTEAFWHGVDPDHPLHNHPVAKTAGAGLKNIYRAADRYIQEMRAAFPDVSLAVFSMSGMGINNSDVPSMALLPELLYRRHFGRPLLKTRQDWIDSKDNVPLLNENESWSSAVHGQLPVNGNKGKKMLRVVLQQITTRPERNQQKKFISSVDWMPAARYAGYWPRMDAFALPSYYDGRIRINLAGREVDGIVQHGDYESLRKELEAYLLQCRDLHGNPVVDHFARHEGNPYDVHPSEADLVVVWRGSPLSLVHPDTGHIGPLPYRRTGGHTGPYGFIYFAGSGIAKGDRGIRSSFDIVPTILDFLDTPCPAGISGRSLLQQ